MYVQRIRYKVDVDDRCNVSVTSRLEKCTQRLAGIFLFITGSSSGIVYFGSVYFFVYFWVYYFFSFNSFNYYFFLVFLLLLSYHFICFTISIIYSSFMFMIIFYL